MLSVTEDPTDGFEATWGLANLDLMCDRWAMCAENGSSLSMDQQLCRTL